MASKNNLAHYEGLNCPSPTEQGVKQTYFVNLSIQVNTALQSATTGRLVTKSMDYTSKPSGWNKNRIQQPMGSSTEDLALLTHAATFDEPFHIRDHMRLLHMIRKSVEHFTNIQVAHKVTAMKLSK